MGRHELKTCQHGWMLHREADSPNVNSPHSKVKAKVAQSSLTLCRPMNCTVLGILQARLLEWIAFPFSRGSSQPRDPTQVS